jgi:hypothetical protein
MATPKGGRLSSHHQPPVLHTRNKTPQRVIVEAGSYFNSSPWAWSRARIERRGAKIFTTDIFFFCEVVSQKANRQTTGGMSADAFPWGICNLGGVGVCEWGASFLPTHSQYPKTAIFIYRDHVVFAVFLKKVQEYHSASSQKRPQQAFSPW